jgi:hypothetical protein
MSPIIGLLASVFLPSVSTLSIHATPLQITCPPMPLNESQWEGGPFWGLFIDGNAAMEGPHAFDPNQQDFFEKVTSVLSRMYASELTTEGKAAPTIKLLDQVHWDFWEKRPDTEHHPGGVGIVPECTDKMDCDDLKSLLHNIPEELYTSQGPCHKNLELRVQDYPHAALENILRDYERGIQESLRSEPIKEKLLDTLATFSRRFGLLHPYREGNGRFRNFLVQRELRRLGLACGAMMYNYNKDVFVDGHERYLGKLKEGIAVFEEAIKSGVNPWTLASTVDRHKREFPQLRGLDQCYNISWFGSGGTIWRTKPNPILD